MHEQIRQVRFKANGNTYALTIFDIHQTDSLGKWRLAYKLTRNGRKTIFEGSDFACSPLHCIDSDETVKSLMGFLTLKPGDTDREYFDNYTPEQMSFAETEAEDLEMAVYNRFGFDD